MAIKTVGKMFVAGCLTATMIGLGGCERKEKVLDVETPAGEVEVEQDKDSGEVDVEVNDGSSS